MKITDNLGDLLLAVFLLLSGLMGLGISFPFAGVITAVVALAAGVLKLIGK